MILIFESFSNPFTQNLFKIELRKINEKNFSWVNFERFGAAQPSSPTTLSAPTEKAIFLSVNKQAI